MHSAILKARFSVKRSGFFAYVHEDILYVIVTPEVFLVIFFNQWTLPTEIGSSECLHLNARTIITPASNLELPIILGHEKAFHEIPRMSLILSSPSSMTTRSGSVYFTFYADLTFNADCPHTHNY